MARTNRDVLTEAQLLNSLEEGGATFITPDGFKITAHLPRELDPHLVHELMGYKPKGELRLLMRCRSLSTWLTSDMEEYVHGESDTLPETFGEWLEFFVDSEKLLRNLYDFEGCIFGDDWPPDSVANCTACSGAELDQTLVNYRI